MPANRTQGCVRSDRRALPEGRRQTAGVYPQITLFQRFQSDRTAYFLLRTAYWFFICVICVICGYSRAARSMRARTPALPATHPSSRSGL
jgi:hypothetical protein